MCPPLRESGGCVPKNLNPAIHLHKDLRLTVVHTSSHYDPTASPSRLPPLWSLHRRTKSRNARSSTPTRRWCVSPMPFFLLLFFLPSLPFLCAGGSPLCAPVGALAAARSPTYRTRARPRDLHRLPCLLPRPALAPPAKQPPAEPALRWWPECRAPLQRPAGSKPAAGVLARLPSSGLQARTPPPAAPRWPPSTPRQARTRGSPHVIPLSLSLASWIWGPASRVSAQIRPRILLGRWLSPRGPARSHGKIARAMWCSCLTMTRWPLVRRGSTVSQFAWLQAWRAPPWWVTEFACPHRLLVPVRDNNIVNKSAN